MAVYAKKSERRCKLCIHPKRADIDALLEQRSRKKKDEDGNQINADYVLAKLAEWEVDNPTLDNIKGHWKNHCEVVSTATIEATQAVAAKKVEELKKGGANVDVDSNLRWIVTVGRAEVEERIARGDKSGITVDHMLKATSELTRRQHNEAQHELLGALAGGLNAALGSGRVPAALPEGDEIIDQVAVEVEDAVIEEVTA